MLQWRYLLVFLFFSGLMAFTLVPPGPTPPGPIGPFLNGVLPSKTPGANGAWSLEDVSEGLSIPSPLRIIPFPGSEDVLVLSKIGEVWRVNLAQQTQQLVLDIKDRAFKEGEAGTTGIALHPEFGNPDAPDKQLIFVFYRYKPQPDSWDEKGFNRLSKFRWDAGSGTFDTSTEQILFQQYDRSTWHNGGGMFFHPDDGFLYLGLGDEGHFHFKEISNQRLDRALFGGLIRIDVDNDPERSHPIRRQPQPSEWGPQDPTWGDTYSQGYSIPNDNPWQSPDSSLMEEFYAIGIRSPYGVSYDPVEDRIWLADVGEVLREEISIIGKGQNLQWPFLEGTVPSEEYARPDEVIGEEQPPLHEYSRDFGNCIIGGQVYRGNLFPNLWGKYLFADYGKRKLMSLDYDFDNQQGERDILIADIRNLGLDLSSSAGITGIFSQPNGDILVTIQSANDFFAPGKILRLTAQETIADPPELLSDLGVFTDLSTLKTVPGILPYQVNSPLWSDGAAKRRWMAIPNDGAFDSPAEKIQFSSREDWQFPEGTVFIKHFELPKARPNGQAAPLETRFFVLGTDGKSYGLTYKWNDEGTDAFLLKADASKTFTLYEGGMPVAEQTWDYPRRDQCLSCHTANANFVLGVKTHQLNGDLTYPASGETLNQLAYLSDVGILDHSIVNPDSYPRAYAIDDTDADLELRVRSYLDANCASCHRLGGVQDLKMDLRFQLPLHLQNLINEPTSSSNSDPNRMIVKPGDHTNSEIWVRDASLSSNQMPPLARSIIDEPYIDYLAEWIDGLPEDAGKVHELIVYPNPSNGWVGLRLDDDWEGPFELEVYNFNGQLVKSDVFSGHSYFINLSMAQPGAYVLKLGNGNSQEVRKFMIQ
ncbi:PQQ-dependent sugar dehydrogenase [Phaeodactylibacter xiamenensis]|uniref:PQQ-dependent sugar dehydrogenase n=1 Tax=Phaeodactylibacter xiamenensis TaxID=1524460 RepID=UPI0024A8D129|nr:PQQ-dependent sugar dehydrogenase [Phaeodactylibacter xiamenensis]